MNQPGIARVMSHDLPGRWRWAKLGKIGSFEAGGTPAKAVDRYWGGDIPFVTGADVTGLLVTRDSARAFLTEAGLRSGKTAVCPPDTILMVTRTGVGRAGIAAELMCASQDITAFRCGDGVLPEYVCWYLISIAASLAESARGATIKGLTRDFVQQLDIPLAPPDEQRRIAELLREQMAAAEKASAASKTRLLEVDNLHRAFLREVFEGPTTAFLNSIRLKDILIPHKEIIHPGDRESGTAEFVGLEHTESNTGRRLGCQTIDLTKLTGRKPTFKKGQIVYGYLRPYLNKVWIAEFDGCSSVDQFAFDVRSDIVDVRFAAWFMRSSTFLGRSAIVTTTGQLPRIGTEEIAAVKIELPSLVRQQEIADRIDGWHSDWQRLRELLTVESATISSLPLAFLKQAFTGDI
jgi:restriction endonuclease S subunit